MSSYHANITINAPTQKVFEALTEPELIKLWQFGKELITDWEVGSEIKFRVDFEEKSLEQWGIILEVKTNELIKYNLFTPREALEDKLENFCITSYILTNEKEQTKVELIQEDNRINSFEVKNLKPILLSLKNIAETH